MAGNIKIGNAISPKNGLNPFDFPTQHNTPQNRNNDMYNKFKESNSNQKDNKNGQYEKKSKKH